MADNEIKQRVTVEGGEQAAAALNKIAEIEAQLAQIADKLTRATDQESAASEKAAKVTEHRGSAEQRLREKMRELSLEETRHQERVERGEQVSSEAAAASSRREREMQRLAARLRVYARAQESANQKIRGAKSVTEDTARSGGAFNSILEKLLGGVRGLVGGLIGVGGLSAALAAIKRSFDENARAAQEFQEAFLNLEFMSEKFDKQEKQFVQRAAVLAGRSPVETVEAYGSLKGFFPNEPKRNLQRLFLGEAETARTTNAPLSAINKAFEAAYAVLKNPVASENAVRAVFNVAAPENPADVANVLGKFATAGVQVGKLGPAESLGFAAAATGLDTRAPEEQITGLRTVLLAIMNPTTDQQKKIVAQAGIDRTNFGTALKTLGESIRSGRMTSNMLTQLVGSFGITTATEFANQRTAADFFAKAAQVQHLTFSPTNLTAEAIDAQFKNNPIAALNFGIQQSRAAIAVAQENDQQSLARKLGGSLLEETLRGKQIGPLNRGLADFLYSNLTAIGISPGTAANIASSFATGTPGISATPNAGPQVQGVSGGGILHEIPEASSPVETPTSPSPAQAPSTVSPHPVATPVSPPPLSRSHADPYVASALDQASSALGLDLNNGSPVVVNQTIIHRNINTRFDPYTGDLGRRFPIR